MPSGKQPAAGTAQNVNNAVTTGKAKALKSEGKPSPNLGGAGWITSENGKKLVKISGKIVTFEPPKDGGHADALWMGQDKKPVNAGENFWLFRVLSGESIMFGLASPEMLKDDSEYIGIFYNRHVSLGIRGLDPVIRDYGPYIKAKDTVGILLSFTKDRIQIYFYINGDCLGLAFSVYPHCYPNGLIPCACFSDHQGSVEMLKHLQPGNPEFPHRRNRVPPAKDQPISGLWMALENSVKMDGKPFNFPVWGIRLAISKEWTDLNGGGRYTVCLISNSRTWFDIQWKRTDTKWQLVEGTLNYKIPQKPPMPDFQRMTLKEERELLLARYGDPDYGIIQNKNGNWTALEKAMKDWVVYPDTVTFHEHRMTITKGKSVVSFQRPGVFEGDIKDAIRIEVEA